MTSLNPVEEVKDGSSLPRELSKYSFMRVLLLGGTGFVGRYVSKDFGNYQDVDLIEWSRKEHGSVLSAEDRRAALDHIRPDVLVNCAWQSTESANYETESSHLRWLTACEQMISECHSYGTRLILLGSGLDKLELKNDSSPYHRAKFHLRELVMSQNTLARISLVSPTYIFSPVDSRPRLLSQISKGIIKSAGDLQNPEQVHDFIEINDVSRAVTLATLDESIGLSVIASGLQLKVREFADLFLKETKMSLPPFPRDPLSFPVETRKLLSRGWYPTETYKFMSGGDVLT